MIWAHVVVPHDNIEAVHFQQKCHTSDAVPSSGTRRRVRVLSRSVVSDSLRLHGL